jgi:hypothetical protein
LSVIYTYLYHFKSNFSYKEISNYETQKNLAHTYTQKSNGADDIYAVLALNVFRKIPVEEQTVSDIYTQSRLVSLNLSDHPDARIVSEEENEVSQEAYVQKLHRQALSRMIRDMEERIKDSAARTHAKKEDIPVVHMLDKLHEQYIDKIPTHTNKEITTMINHATQLQLALQTEKKETAIEKLKDAQTNAIVSDPQNVHSSHVNNDARRIYDLLPLLSPDESVQLSTEIMDICKHCPKCTLVCNTMLSNVSTSVQHLNDTEHNILLRVWKRIHDPCNEKHQIELEDAFLISLEECVTTTNMDITCTVGRVNRVLACLTLLDANPIVAQGLMTNEMIKHVIYDAVQQEIKFCLNVSPILVVKWYNGEIQMENVTETERMVLQAFRISIRKAVHATVRSICTQYNVSPISTDRYVTECLSVLD